MAWAMRMGNCTACNRPTVGSTMKNAPNVCVSCGGYFCRNMFTGFPKATCGVAFVCMNCLKKLEPGKQEQVRKEMTNMLIAFNVVAGIGITPMIIGLVLMFTTLMSGEDVVLGNMISGLVLILCTLGFLLPWTIAFPYVIRSKAVKMMGVPV